MRIRLLLLTAVCLLVGLWFMAQWNAAGVGPRLGIAAFDTYMYYLPNMLYALQRLAAGGSGLLWNPFQNCGQPQFEIGSTGMLYPVNVLFLVLEPDRALRAVAVVNFTIAGLGMYGLSRALGAGRLAAVCGAVAFELSTATVDLTTWAPFQSGPWVWLPAAMWCCERLLRGPSFGWTIGLAVVLAIALLPGSPQAVFFTYQLIALRVVFELVTSAPARDWRIPAAIAAGLVLAPLLVAVQMLPAAQMASQSVRGANLNTDEILAGDVFKWDSLMHTVGNRADVFNPFVILPTVVAAAAGLRAATRRAALFYALAGAIYLALAFGRATPLFDLYRAMPFGGLFREPGRFTWVVSFCITVLAALGLDAVLARSTPTAAWRRWVAPLCLTAGLIGMNALTPNGLLRGEWMLGGALIAGAALIGVGRVGRPLGIGLVVLAPLANVLAYPITTIPSINTRTQLRVLPIRRLMPNHKRLYLRYGGVLGTLGQRMTAQDRVYFVYEHTNFTLMPKTASLFGLPSIQDYEPQPTRRSAAFTVQLRNSERMTNLNQFYLPKWPGFPPRFPKPLLDLSAARYVVVHRNVDNNAQMVSPPLYPLAVSIDGKATVYENRQALPRAFFVPRLLQVKDADTALKWLAEGVVQPRHVALIEEAPANGFFGGDPSTDPGEVEFLVNEPEHIVLKVRAPARGFVHLADQYFPGWQATVDGQATPILRANYLFRAVEVPEGVSTVEFRYAPASVRIGAAVSATTIAGLLAVALWRRRRTRTTG